MEKGGKQMNPCFRRVLSPDNTKNISIHSNLFLKNDDRRCCEDTTPYSDKDTLCR